MNIFIPKKETTQLIVSEYGSPVFVTDAERLRSQAQKLLAAFAVINAKIFYAIKANFDPHIVRVIKDTGIYGIDAVSPYEVRLALEIGYTSKQIIFTPSNPSREEMRYVHERGILQNLGSLSELARFGEMFPGSDVSMRICPEIGAGENNKVTTGQIESKFGIARGDVSEVKKLCKKYDLSIVGIHSHIGSGIYDAQVFSDSAKAVCAIAADFSCVDFVDLGGGFGVYYKPEDKEIDLDSFALALVSPIEELEKKLGKKIEVRIEPGKFLVTNATVLLTTITTIKKKGGIRFIGVDSGFNHLIRPAMYDAYHHIVNISHPDGKSKEVSVVGNVCETCDVFNSKIELAEPREGDLLAILSAGAYGASMSSNYNLRAIALHVLIDGENITLTRERQSYEQIMKNFIPL